MIFGNPVRGPIHPTGWKRPSGNVDFRVSQPFGCTGFARERPFGSCDHFHRGIDLGNGKCGADVLAAAAGTVRYAGRDPFDGAIVVMIDHGGGWWTGYWHLRAEVTSVGAKVAKGQKIGEVGTTGNSTACHLHFFVKRGMPAGSTTAQVAGDKVGTWVDPWPQLAQNVTVRPKADGVNIRSSAGSGSTLGALFAQAKPDGHIHRASDGFDLGATSVARKWGGTVIGASYSVGGVTGHTWERIWLDGAYRYIATPLAIRSAS